IYFPAGTDMLVQLTEPLLATDPGGRVPVYGQFDADSRDSLTDLARSIPERTVTTKGREADVVNLVFIGSREQIEEAFESAGWIGSDPLTAGSVMRGFHAVFALRNYPQLPMARHLLSGQSENSTWQKSLDSFDKRDHLRIWAQQVLWEG